MAQRVAIKQTTTLPVIAARGLVVFPNSLIHLDISRERSVEAIRRAMEEDRRLFIVTQRDVMVEEPAQSDLYSIGVVVEIKQFLKHTEDEYKILVSGEYKARLLRLTSTHPFLEAEVRCLPTKAQPAFDSIEIEASIRLLKIAFEKYAMILPKISQELVVSVERENDPTSLFMLIVNNTMLKFEDKQVMLEENNLLERIRLLIHSLNEETQILMMEKEIFEKVQVRIDQNQREYFLREQAKIINEELGYDEEYQPEEETQNYIDRIEAIQNISSESREKLLSEARRLYKMPPSSHEAYVIENYLDTVLELPWDESTVDRIDIKAAQKQLDKDHYGLEKVKERVLENLAVRKFAPEMKGQIICFVGPPGVGKTSVAKSIATALGRKYVRIALGGISDESDIRGHRKTYIGAMPGRIITAIKQAKSRNPLILLDEIDKMGSSFKGDPSSAMLEVLDGEQNSTFVDHYVEIPFDLSDCLFVTTANTLSTIPDPLLDRMEVIELSSYTLEEKFNICKKYLIPKQRKKHGLNAKQIKITDEAVYALIDSYTRESGVRKLERIVATLCRKTAKLLAENGTESVRFTAKNLENHLGPKKYLGEKIADSDQVGLVNGLAWTSVGGELLQIEASVMDGKGQLQLTGNLGNVMKESANTALSYVRSVAHQYGIDPGFYQKKDIHIHVPEGAVPKDGPSAGVALATVLVSALSGIPIRRDVAMTGEITLRGRDLPIGGLKEKAIAAFKSGVKTVLIPDENKSDLEEIDSAVRDSLTFIPCKTAEEVLSAALAQPKAILKKSPRPERKHSAEADKETTVIRV